MLSIKRHTLRKGIWRSCGPCGLPPYQSLNLAVAAFGRGGSVRAEACILLRFNFSCETWLTRIMTLPPSLQHMKMVSGTVDLKMNEA